MGWADKMRKEMTNEDIGSYLKDAERTFGIAGGCLIDTCLEHMLQSIMVENIRISDPIVNKLFDSYQPLSTLAAKIDCAYAFGLIDKQTKDDLHYIRKIRNEFAHNIETLSFDDSPIRDWCQELSAVKNKEIETDDLKDAFIYTISKTRKLSSLHIQELKKKLSNKKPSE